MMQLVCILRFCAGSEKSRSMGHLSAAVLRCKRVRMFYIKRDLQNGYQKVINTFNTVFNIC